MQGRSAVVESSHDKAIGPHGESAPRAGAWATVRAVLWSFFGVRGRSGHEQDMARLNPIYVILTGVGLAALFVLSLIMLVKWVVA
ncbi:MAG: hypothetical protein RL322_413 [Pseudomonadota bacterium]